MKNREEMRCEQREDRENDILVSFKLNLTKTLFSTFITFWIVSKFTRKFGEKEVG